MDWKNGIGRMDVSAGVSEVRTSQITQSKDVCVCVWTFYMHATLTPSHCPYFGLWVQCVCVCACMLRFILSVVPFGFGFLPPLGQEGLLIISNPLKLLIWWGGWAWHVLLVTHHVLHTTQPTRFNTDTSNDAPTQALPVIWLNNHSLWSD